jgi:hypothetical protein
MKEQEIKSKIAREIAGRQQTKQGINNATDAIYEILKKQLNIHSVSVSLPDTDELFKLAHDYAYKRCSLQNFDSEAEIELVKIRYVHGYEQALKDFVNGDYDPDQLCNER